MVAIRARWRELFAPASVALSMLALLHTDGHLGRVRAPVSVLLSVLALALAVVARLVTRHRIADSLPLALALALALVAVAVSALVAAAVQGCGVCS